VQRVHGCVLQPQSGNIFIKNMLPFFDISRKYVQFKVLFSG
jgi:hypothetical protein